MDCIVHGVAMSQTQLSNFLYWLLTHTHTYTHELHYCRDVGLESLAYFSAVIAHTHTHTHIHTHELHYCRDEPVTTTASRKGRGTQQARNTGKGQELV